jgi:hypothetical protein
MSPLILRRAVRDLFKDNLTSSSLTLGLDTQKGLGMKLLGTTPMQKGPPIMLTLYHHMLKGFPTQLVIMMNLRENGIMPKVLTLRVMALKQQLITLMQKDKPQKL